MAKRFDELQSYKKIGEKNISLKPINFIGLKIADFTDIKFDSQAYDNTSFAKAYDFESVTLSNTQNK